MKEVCAVFEVLGQEVLEVNIGKNSMTGQSTGVIPNLLMLGRELKSSFGCHN